MTEYVEVRAPYTVRLIFAEHVAARAARALGIPVPRVRFFAHGQAPDGWAGQSWTDERHLAGEYRPDHPDEVWVLQTQQAGQLADTVAHEVHHAWWHRSRGWPSRTQPAVMAECERAARAFAAAFTHRKE